MNQKILFVLIVLFSFGAAHVVSARPASALSDAPPSLGFSEIASGLSSPVSITNAGDASGRLFITLQGGSDRHIFEGTSRYSESRNIVGVERCYLQSMSAALHWRVRVGAFPANARIQPCHAS